MLIFNRLTFSSSFGILYLQNYSRDLFLFLYFLLIIVAAITSFKVHQDKSTLTGKSVLYLNRHQTEEWKGWMQVFSIVCLPYDIYLTFCSTSCHARDSCNENV